MLTTSAFAGYSLTTTGALTTREGFLSAIKLDNGNPLLRAMYADWCEDQGDEVTARAIRAGTWTWQQTTEGEEVVTVGRDGARQAGCKNGYSCPVWCSKVYRAVRRKSDGLLTWRLVSSCNDGTAGREVSGPMIERAEAVAERRGLEFCDYVRHGSVCR